MSNDRPKPPPPGENPFIELAKQIRQGKPPGQSASTPQGNPRLRNLPPPPPTPRTPPQPKRVPLGGNPSVRGRQPPPNAVVRATQPQPSAQPPTAQATPPASPSSKDQDAGLSTDQVYTMAKMGYAQWEYGKLDRARAIFQTLIASRPQEYWFRSMLGSIFQRQKQFAQAIQQYNIAIQLKANDIPSRVNRGEILLKVGKRQEGIADLKHAVKLDPSGKHPSALRAKSLLVAINRSNRQLTS